MNKRSVTIFLFLAMFSFTSLPMAHAKTVGPDSFGYIARDIGTPFSWIEIAPPAAGSGIVITNLTGGYDAEDVIPIGFDFSFYGNTYSTIRVGENGILSFDSAGSSDNQCIPNAGIPNALILPFWGDLRMAEDTNAVVCYQTFGSAPNRRTVVEYFRIPTAWSATPPLTFEAILYEELGKIKFQYTDISPYNYIQSGGYATIGIENTNGTDGVQWSCDQSYAVSNHYAIMIGLPGPDLELEKYAEGPVLNQTNMFSLMLTNRGPGAASNIVVRDVLPAGYRFVEAWASTGTWVGSDWTIPDLPANAQMAYLSINVVLTNFVRVTNTAEVVAMQPFDFDSTPDNHDPGEDDQSSVLVTPEHADLSIIKLAPGTNTTGTELPYILIISNNGPDAAWNARVFDSLPQGNSLGDTWATNLGDLAAGSVVTVRLSVVISNEITGEAWNTAQIDTDSVDTNYDNDWSQVQTVINHAPAATNDFAATFEDTPVVINVLTNDVEPDAEDAIVGVSGVSQGTYGSVTINPGATNVTYSPNADYSGMDSFTYRVSDQRGGTGTAQVVVRIWPVTDPVTLTVHNSSGLQDTRIPLDLQASFGDSLDGSEIHAIMITNVPLLATLSAGINNSNGSWILMPEQLAGLTILPETNNSANINLLVSAGAVDSAQLPCAADAYVFLGSPSYNWGALSNLSVFVNDQESYLRFDLDQLPAGSQLAGAAFGITYYRGNYSSGDQNHYVHFVADDSWGEYSIVWTNRPSLGASLGSWDAWNNGTPVTRHYTADVSTAAVTEYAGDGKLSLALIDLGDCWGEYYSREFTINEWRPYLQTYLNPTTVTASVLVQVRADSDHDSLDDDWEMENFKNLTLADGATDYDFDGYTDLEELIAHTQPTNINDYFEVEKVGRSVSAAGVIVFWESYSNRYYDLFRGSNLFLPFIELRTNLSATPPVNTYTDSPPSAAHFYRIKVRR